LKFSRLAEDILKTVVLEAPRDQHVGLEDYISGLTFVTADSNT